MNLTVTNTNYLGHFSDSYPYELTCSVQTGSLTGSSLYLNEIDVNVLMQVTQSSPSSKTIQSWIFRNVPVNRAFEVVSASTYTPCISVISPNYQLAQAQAAGYTIRLLAVTSVTASTKTVQNQFIHFPLSSSL